MGAHENAERREIDMRYFMRDNNRCGYICSLDGELYPDEMFFAYDNSHFDKVYVGTIDEAIERLNKIL